MAQVVIPARRGKKPTWPNVTVINPGKGLNNLISENLIANEEASDLLNIQFIESGCVTKRFGHTAVGTGLSNNPKGMGSYIVDSTHKYLLTIDGTALKYLNGTTWTTISGASFTTAKNTIFTQCRGDMYIWNGTDAAAKLSTSSLTLTRPANTVSAAFSIYFSGRQIAAGTSTNVSRLYISNISDAGDFTVNTGGTAPQPDNATDAPGATAFTSAGTPGLSEANILDVAKDDGDKITGLAKFQEKLIIFKERSIWSLSFDASFTPTLQQISSSRGCVSHRSIDSVENDIYFLSRNGYYILGNQANFQNTIRTNELSSRVHPVIDSITPANLPNTASINSGYVFYSSISTSTTSSNNATLTHDSRYDAWSVLNSVNANAFTEFIDTSNVQHLYYAADDEAKVYEIDTGHSDNGTGINAYWTSKAFDLGDFSLYKQFIDVDLLFRQITGTVTVTLIADGTTVVKTSSISNIADQSHTWASDMWGDGSWGGTAATAATTSTGTATQNVPYRIRLNIKARSLKIKISNSTDQENFVLLGIKLYYRPFGHESFPSALKIT